jgi:cytochrome c oxidase subunit 1
MTFVTSFLLVLAFPVITVALTELMLDRFFGTNFFVVTKGASPVLWQHLFWVFGHPEVYILILPAMGIVSEVLPTFSGKPLFGYAVVVYSGIAIGFMSFGVWAHHMFAVGMGPIADAIFAVNTMLIAVPTGVKIFNWIGTMWGGNIRFTTAMNFSIGFVSMFIIGGLSGVMHASPPADLQQTDTYFIVAHFHYVLFGGSILGLFSGLYYWWPKITGRFLGEGLGTLHFWLTIIGMNLLFMPMHWTGLLGMPRRVYTYGPELGVTGLNQLSTIGAYITALSALVFVFNVWRSLRRPKTATANPWNAATLEWSIPSPPPPYNFREVPVVHSRDPLWEQHDQESGGHKTDELTLQIAGQEIGSVDLPDDRPQESPDHADDAHGHGIHMPNPSFYPLIAALGVGLVFSGLVVSPVVSVCGLLVLFYGIYSWSLEPAG